jgi:hypothetical protein
VAFPVGPSRSNVGLLACGEGCPVTVAAVNVLTAVGFTFALVLCFGMLPLMLRQLRAAEADIDLEAAKVRNGEKSAFWFQKFARTPLLIG